MVYVLVTSGKTLAPGPIRVLGFRALSKSTRRLPTEFGKVVSFS